MAGTSSVSLLQAINEVKDELTQVIAVGNERLGSQIQQLRGDHTALQLEQAKLNAGFADRSRLEDLSGRVNVLAARVENNTRRLNELDEKIRTLAAAQDDLSAAMRDANVHLLATATGYLVTALLMTGTALLTYVLSHLL